MTPQKIVPFLWFDGVAEEAAAFYTSLFPNSRVTGTTPGSDGNALVVEFELAGVAYCALNGGPHFKLTEAFSLQITCDTQAEVDELWDKLAAGGGSHSHCGWLKDRFGLSWQVVPAALLRLVKDPDRAKAGRVMQAMMGMSKIDVRALEAAAAAH